MPFRRLLRALPLVVGAMCVTSGAWAEPSEPELEAARRSFSEGLRLEEYRDFVGALERFEAVASVKTTPQVRFHRALCLEKLGRWVDAREEFVRARDAALGDGEELQRVRLSSQAHVNWLDGQLPAMILHLEPPEARVMLDARVLPLSLATGRFPLDPGPHMLRVTAPGHSELLEHLQVSPRQSLQARVVLQRLGAVAGARRERSRAPFYVSGSVAVASLAGAAVAIVLRGSAMQDLDAQCGAMRRHCPETARGLEARGATLNTLSNVFIGVGVSTAGLALGAWFFSRSPDKDAAPAKPPSSLRISLAGPALPVGTGW